MAKRALEVSVVHTGVVRVEERAKAKEIVEDLQYMFEEEKKRTTLER